MPTGGGLRKGSTGPGAAVLQTELLRARHYPGSIDGVFAEKTANAVREFQARRCHMPTAEVSWYSTPPVVCARGSI